MSQSNNKKLLVVNQVGAGAGVMGLAGFAGFVAVAAIFFVTENYFISLLFMSLALLVYVTGTDMGRVLLSSFTIFFSSKHLLNQAASIQEMLISLDAELKKGPLTMGQVVRLPDNPLVREVQKLLEEKKGFDYIEYAAHTYYVECHELYDYTSANLDFVAVSMPIFGLMGTVLGLMSLFDNLGGEITVEALSPQLAMALKTTLYGALFSAIYKIMGSRFEQRIKTLDYDYDSLCRGLQVLLENQAKIEITK